MLLLYFQKIISYYHFVLLQSMYSDTCNCIETSDIAEEHLPFSSWHSLSYDRCERKCRYSKGFETTMTATLTFPFARDGKQCVSDS